MTSRSYEAVKVELKDASDDDDDCVRLGLYLRLDAVSFLPETVTTAESNFFGTDGLLANGCIHPAQSYVV